MVFFEELKKILLSHGVELFAPIPLKSCKIQKKYLLEKVGIEDGTVIICAVPYLSKNMLGNHNISAYCAVRDYHGFFDELWKDTCFKLSALFESSKFAGFADHSPIDERDAALRAGIGIMGDNGMIITEKYSSYVFLGEIITDIIIDTEEKEPQHCIGCKKCLNACPMSELGDCLSAITQKKGELTASEADAMRKYDTVWGCDICQRVCPYTESAIKSGSIFTNIEYFLTDVIPDLDIDILNSLNDKAFSERAFSWRGRNTVIRNLKISKSDGIIPSNEQRKDLK